MPAEGGNQLRVREAELDEAANFTWDAATAIKELQATYLDVPNTDANQTVYFARHGDTAVGVYVGIEV